MASSNFSEFERELRLSLNDFDHDSAVFAGAVAQAALSGVVYKTPVGNPLLWKSKPPAGYVGGRARANWQVSIGLPATGQLDVIDQAGIDTIERGRIVLSAFSAVGPTIWITNNVDYIVRLEDGHSSQAPQGMAAVTVEEVRAQFP